MKKKILKNSSIIGFIIFALGSLLCGVLSSFLIDYKLDYFSYSCVNYNSEILADDSFEPTIINVKKDFAANERKEYSSLYKNFYYNFMVETCREKIDNSISFDLSDSDSFSTELLTQPSFSIETTEKDGGGYYLDYGLYYTYYSDKILGERNYLLPRFNCNSFIFISDVLANELIDYYGISNVDDPYAELITNEEYAVLPLMIDSADTSIKFSINNILYSDRRDGERTVELYNSFALIPYVSEVMNNLDVSFEVDLKTNPYGNKTCIKNINELGYTTDNSTFSVYSYNRSTSQYEINTNLSANLANIWTNTNDVLLYALLIMTMLIGLGINFYFNYFNYNFGRKDTILYLIQILLFIVYGIICSFIYIYPLFSLFPILYLLSFYIFKRKEITNEIKKFFRKSHETNSKNLEEFYNLEV